MPALARIFCVVITLCWLCASASEGDRPVDVREFVAVFKSVRMRRRMRMGIGMEGKMKTLPARPRRTREDVLA